MPTRPSAYSRWADVGGAISPAPTSGRQDTGWNVGDEPAAQHLNYLINLQYQWQKYFDEVFEAFAIANLVLRAPGFSTTDIKGVCIGGASGTRFVAVAAGKIAYSDDGVKWTEQLAGGTNNYKVIYANGLFGVLSDGKQVFTSPDGITWTSRALPAAIVATTPREIVYGNGNWVVIYSVDDAATDTNLKGIAYSPDGGVTTAFVMADSGQSGRPAFFHCTYDHNLFVAVGDTGAAGSAIVSTSTDGITWTPRNSGAIATLHPTPGVATQPIYGNGLWLVAYATHIYTSPDGGATAWVDQGAVSSTNIRSIAWNGSNLFVLVGDTGTIYTSPDGVTWTLRTSGTTNRLNRVTWSGKYWVATGVSGTVLSSTDGITWTLRDAGFSTNDVLYSVSTPAPHPPDYVFVGVGGSLASSWGMV